MTRKRLPLCFLLFIVTLSLSGCGGNGFSGSASEYDGGYSKSADSSYNSTQNAGSGFADSGNHDSSKNASSEKETGNDNVTSEDGLESGDIKDNKTESTINPEKIIYSGNIRVYTEEFDKTMDSLNQLISENSGFIEKSSFRDSNASSGYKESYDSNYSYEATIRVPSKNFDKVMNSIGELGKASEKSTNAENVTQEYHDINATLEVYQAQRERYMEQLKKTKDDSIALQLQDKIMNLDTTIAQYKSRMNTIDNQVSYSSIKINVDEYYVYEEEIEREDSFLQKIVGVFKEAGENIGDMLLVILNFVTIWLIRIIVYGVLVILIIKLIIWILRFFGLVKTEQRVTLKNILQKKNKNKKNVDEK